MPYWRICELPNGENGLLSAWWTLNGRQISGCSFDTRNDGDNDTHHGPLQKHQEIVALTLHISHVQ